MEIINSLSPEELNDLINRIKSTLNNSNVYEVFRNDLGKYKEIQRLIKENGAEQGLSELERRSIQMNVAESIIRVANQQKSQGSEFSSGLLRWAESVLGPSRVPYHKIFASVVSKSIVYSLSGHRFSTYKRPSRRQVPDVVLPSKRDGKIKVSFVLDTSASVSDKELGMYLREIREVFKRYGPRCEVRYYSADTHVHATGVLQKFDVNKIIMRGHGGTLLNDVIEDISNRKERCDLMIVLTDGYTPWPDQKPKTIPHVVVGLTHPPSNEYPIPQWVDWVVKLFPEKEMSLG